VSSRVRRIVLAFSGSQETLLAIPWLKEQHGAEVTALTLDFGQGRALEAVRDQALAAGAARAHVLDVRDEFAREFVLPSLKADALGNGGEILAHALTRPLISRKLVEIADIESADAVAHGWAAPGGGPSALDELIRTAGGDKTVILPPGEWAMDHGQQLAFAAAHGISYSPRRHPPCRVEMNLWGRTIRCDGAPSAAVFTLTREPADCPAEPAMVDIAFERGVPRAINGVFMPLLELIASLRTIAGAHGVGRLQADGAACEAPAALLLHEAHRALQEGTAASELAEFARSVARAYADIIARGQWFMPLREALDAFVDNVQQRVNGTVRLKLFKGELVRV
jgi:argininosuccinate synthase